MSDYLSELISSGGIELYYTPSEFISENFLLIKGDENKHIVNVMRHKINDELFITNGEGIIFKGIINSIKKDFTEVLINDKINFENKFQNIFFCIPLLKSSDRFEFALEKCTELGITNFIIFTSRHSIKKSANIKRLEKIVLAAMKQSLRSYLPKIYIKNELNEILNLDGRKILLDQNAKKSFYKFELNKNDSYYFIFGPEGDLDKNEKILFAEENIFKLTENRLRSETAIISTAVILNYI